MNKHEVTFQLNAQEKITLMAEHSIENWNCCYDVPVVFFTDSIHYKLCEYDVRSSMEELSEKLTQALANKLQLHPSIKHDIGYLWNEAYGDKPGFVYKLSGKASLWVGHKYKFWTAGGKKFNTITWMYNDFAGSIILEITPEYRWEFEDEGMEEDEDFISYDEFIKNYQPLIIRIISADVARKWLEQANAIVKHIDENIARMELEIKEEREAEAKK